MEHALSLLLRPFRGACIHSLNTPAGRVQNLLDYKDEDVMGGSLNVVHYCSDAKGNPTYQVIDN